MRLILVAVETEGFVRSGIPGTDFEAQMIAQTPLGRIAQPRDIARSCGLLASSESAWVTGETLPGRRRFSLIAIMPNESSSQT